MKAKCIFDNDTWGIIIVFLFLLLINIFLLSNQSPMEEPNPFLVLIVVIDGAAISVLLFVLFSTLFRKKRKNENRKTR